MINKRKRSGREVKRMFKNFLNMDFLTIFLILGFSMKLAMRKRARDTHIPYLWLTVFCTVGLVAAVNLEYWAQEDPDRIFWRTLFNVIGYVLRPVASLSLVLVVANNKKHRLLLWIPAIINLLIMCSAFFCDLPFGFDENYSFYRGPLGYSVFVVGFFYILLVLVYVWKWFSEGYKWEGAILVLCAVCTVICTFIDMLIQDGHLNSAIMISVIFYYMFIRSRDTNRDAMTNLLNRQSFYEDMEMYQARATAVASIDMNGLKRLNDVQGHDAGDQALAAIGESLLAISGRSVIPYRMGGDEFVVLFLNTGEEKIRALLDTVRADVKEKGYSVSAGYAMRQQKETIVDLYKLSDRQMYLEKAEYYKSPDHNRRSRRE